MRKSILPLILLSAVVLTAAAPESRTGSPWRYFSPAHEQSEREIEAALLSLPSTASLGAFHELVSSRPHVAGSAGDARVIESLVDAYKRLGLKVETQDLWLYLSRPVAARLALVAPEHQELPLKEKALPQDPYSRDPDLTIGWNAYSGNGDVEASVVYANYARLEDFKELAKLGVSVRGKLVLARYGGNFRGYKAKFAERAGAAGLIIYSDPKDSGYGRGLMYPEGGWADASYIQRGSILTLPYQGDPLTPFIAATRDAKRLDPSQVDLPRIPVQPIGWGAAEKILAPMGGAPVPDEWQGALPFNYHLGGTGSVRVRLMVEQKRELMHTANVVATLEGDRFPEQKVIIGSHDDAWSFGAGDPNSGTIVVYEAAKSFAALARRGLRPARSIVFANWTAEEFGLE
ncbi:MAG TPA: M28 family peptidase, partial [Thermoanaerobaculia bacterium]|nr:M28 family peptidase [Thermoanaerobaculia bacterium]